MNASFVIFVILAVTAIAAAIAMLLSKNTIYSALYLIVNFIAVAAIYLTLGAPFVALAQLTVYAGAIMILFLFVIMMLGAEQFREQELLKWQRPAAIILGLGVIGESLYALISRVGTALLTNPPSETLADPKALGQVLFTKYVLPFELTAVLLLAAAVGAVVLTRGGKKEQK